MMELFLPIIQALIAGAGLAITGLLGIYIPRMIAAFEARTHIQLTDQQRAAVMQAARTEAGLVETALQQGALQLAQIKPDSPEMLARARAALARVPEAAAFVGTTPQAMAAIVVGAADTIKPATILAVPISTTLAIKDTPDGIDPRSSAN